MEDGNEEDMLLSISFIGKSDTLTTDPQPKASLRFDRVGKNYRSHIARRISNGTRFPLLLFSLLGNLGTDTEFDGTIGRQEIIAAISTASLMPALYPEICELYITLPISDTKRTTSSVSGLSIRVRLCPRRQ